MDYLTHDRIPLSDYMLKSLEQRKSHLDPSEPCLELGADSTGSRALLAVFLNTTCESLGMKTGYLCHNCGNPACSNPKHLYWGSCSENNRDRFIHDPTLPLRIVKSKGLKSRQRTKSSKGDFCLNKLTEKQIQERFEKVLASDIDLQSHGWVRLVSSLWGVSHTEVRRFFDRYWKGDKPYKRTNPGVSQR